jgi:hypothetical protein
MLCWFHKKLKPITRGLLASLAVLWLIAGAAPCVMAQSQPMNHATVHCPMHDGGMNLDTNDCGPVTAVSCQMPDLQSPLAAAMGDMAVTPVLLTVLPIDIAVPDNRIFLRHDFFSPDIPAPPLHIQHLTLIL